MGRFDAGVDLRNRIIRSSAQILPQPFQIAGLPELLLLSRPRQRVVELLQAGLLNGFAVLGGDPTFAAQLVAIEALHGGMGPDQLVHLGLGEGRLVPFVVPVAPEADEVDHHAAVELLTVLRCQADGVDARFRVIAVDVENGHVQHLSDGGAIERPVGLVGVGGEADLVVDDQVDGAAGRVPGQCGQVQRLRHHSLSGERGIAVNQ